MFIKFEHVTTLRNLENSIHHPTVFYKADEWEVSLMQDWYTHSDSEMKYQNDYLWNDKKTENRIRSLSERMESTGNIRSTFVE
ncbi:MAG: hypothetical protein LIP08_04450 [Bacteroides sp.]|nr:hypothetical protein [Bacteroides sp.]